MKPLYETPDFLTCKWTSKALSLLTELDIRKYQPFLDAAIYRNHVVYLEAVAGVKAERTQFRREHPRKQLPSYLKNLPVKPPKLADMWRKLLIRRQSLIRKVQYREGEKRYIFLERMEQGRYQAMLGREKSIRRLIDNKAIEMGVILTQRSLDARLAELFEKVLQLA